MGVMIRPNIEDRLNASVRHDAVHGDASERAICASQMREAASTLASLRARVAELESLLRRAKEMSKHNRPYNFACARYVGRACNCGVADLHDEIDAALRGEEEGDD